MNLTDIQTVQFAFQYQSLSMFALNITDKRKVSKAVVSVKRQYGRVGFPYTFDQRELKAIAKPKRVITTARKRPLSDIININSNNTTTVDDINPSLNISPTPTTQAASTFDVGNNSTSCPPPKKQRVSHTTTNNHNTKRWVWTQSRTSAVIKEAIREKIFDGAVDVHDEICKRIHVTCCVIDPAFNKIGVADMKSKIYQIQRKVSGTPADKLEELKEHEKSMRGYLDKVGALQDSFYIHDSASYILTISNISPTNNPTSFHFIEQSTKT